MEGPRAPREMERQAVINFLDQQLRPQSDWSIANEYPLAFQQSNFKNVRIIQDEETVVSHAVWKPVLIRTPQAVYKFAAIGSVVTETKFRKQGLSSKILESCVSAAREEECDFAVLWTDKFDFYRKIGFELAGSEINYTYDQLIPEKLDNVRILEGNKVSPESIHKVYQKHTVNSHRTLSEIQENLRIPNSRVYTAWDNITGQLLAYAIEGKGLDLQGYIHEWGGNVTALIQILNHMLHQRKRAFHILVPRHSQNLILTFDKYGLKNYHGYLGMIKLLNSKRICAKAEKYLKNALQRNDIELKPTAEETILFKTNNSELTLTEAEFVQLIFGPKFPKVCSKFSKEDYAQFTVTFPMPLWVWGWDSI